MLLLQGESYTVSSVRDFMDTIGEEEFQKVFEESFREEYERWLRDEGTHPSWIGEPATISRFIEFCWESDIYEGELMEEFLDARDGMWIMHWEDYNDYYTILELKFPNATDKNDILFHMLKQSVPI